MGRRSGRRQRSGRRDSVLSLVYVGIGGWDYAPWRGRFYPAGLPKGQELGYAAARLSSIEINGTFYRTQSAESFAKWREATPPGFVFSVKAARAASYAREPDKLAAAVARFLGSGITVLGEKLGAILWQFPATRRFDAVELAGFLGHLPPSHEGVALRHVIEAKHASFDDPAYAALLRDHGVADCMVETAERPARAPTTDFAYLRLQRTLAEAPEGYDAAELDRWAGWVRAHAAGLTRGVFVYFISGAKERAPDAAMALLRRLG